MNVEKHLLRACRKLPSDSISVLLSHSVVHRSLSLLVGQKTYSERIALRKLRPHPTYAALSDKMEVRAFVEERIGDQYLVQLYEIIDDADDFDFSTLPRSYVMKATHGSGWVKLVTNGHQADVGQLRALAGDWLSDNYFPKYRERHYRSIRPRVMFEQLLLDSGTPAKDYKIHCFRKGDRFTQIVQLHSDRFSDHRVNFFSADWRPLDVSHGYESAHPSTITKPEQLDALLQVSDLLSRGMNYVRVDLYVASGRVFFGELTFTPGAGLLRFHPKQMDRQWASLFDPD